MGDIFLHLQKKEEDKDYHIPELDVIEPKYGERVINNNLDLLISGKYSDLKINCNGVQFTVHKAVVCPRCPFFERACSSAFKEAKENAIDMPADHPQIVVRVLMYLYTSNFPTLINDGNATGQVYWKSKEGFTIHTLLPNADHPPHLSDPENTSLSSGIIALVYILADRLMIEDLKRLCRSHMEDRVKSVSDEELEQVTQLTYTEDVEMLAAFNAILIYEWQQRVQKSLSSSSTVRELIQTFPAFGLDMALTGRNRKKVWCTACLMEIEIKDCHCGLTGQCGKGNWAGNCTNLLGTERERSLTYCHVCMSWGSLRYEWRREENSEREWQ